jgi:hypothetical protein
VISKSDTPNPYPYRAGVSGWSRPGRSTTRPLCAAAGRVGHAWGSRDAQARWAVGTWAGMLRTARTRRLRWPEVLDVVDLPGPVPGDGQQSYQLCDTPLAELGGAFDDDVGLLAARAQPEDRRRPRKSDRRWNRPTCGSLTDGSPARAGDQSWKSVLTLSSSHSSASARAVPSTRR